MKAADVTIRGLTIRGSGLSLIDKNSGIFVDRGGDRVRIENNKLEDNLIGIYLDGPHDAVVRDNRILGLRRLRVSERGPAISLWNTPGSVIENNDIRFGRDGVFSVTSNHDVVRGNTFHDVRYAVHFMYTNHSEVIGNLSEGNLAGYAMMYSDQLTLRDNVSDADHDNGLLFNYANDSSIEGNVVRGSDKCVFIYNANKNRFAGNWFQGCEIGVHFTAGSEGNELTENAFVNNRHQVKYVGTRFLDWSVNGRGNYYSDNPAFDLKGTGIADTAYRPNDLMDQVIWRAPAAKILLNSPAVQVVRWAQARFPAIHPGGVIEFGAADDAAASAGFGAAGAMTKNVVDMRGVSRNYRRQYAVREVDLTLEAGECVALVGHNGAGKTTMIKMMLGLVRPSSGSIRVLGEDPAGGAATRARFEIGYLPENVSLHPSMTGVETLAFYARLKRQAAAAVLPMLERVGIAEAARRRVGEYSKGMRQQLGLAQALLGSPRALLLDEPTSGLDPALRQHFYEIIRDLCSKGAMVLLSSHALAEVEGQADRVVVMNQGRKVADGSIAELRKLAGIRPRIRVRLPRLPRAVANAPDAWSGWSASSEGVLELSCEEGDVSSVLRGLPSSAADIEIIRPSLDDLYASFQKGGV